MKTILICFITLLSFQAFSQNKDVPVRINLIDGGNVDAIHFGQLKCGNSSSLRENYIIIRGKYLGSITEIVNYSDIKKITLDGYNAGPEASAGNQKGTIYIQKSDGNTFTLEEAEISLSCYGPGDKYNQLIVQILNPINNKRAEATVNTRDVHSIDFK